MDRVQVEAIVDGDRDAAIEVLLAMSAQLAALTSRVEELERQVAKSSRNSSKPPSSDPPWVPKQQPKKPSGRKRGGQDGHEGHSRMLMRADRVEVQWPVACRCCGEQLEQRAAQAVQRHQVAELPPVAVEVVEYQLNAVRCQGCHAVTRASLPGGVSRSAFGPRLHALVGTLSADARVSRRGIHDLLNRVLKCPISLGSVDALLQRLGAQLAEPYVEAVDHVRAASVVCADETGWKLAGERCWMWGAFTPDVGVMMIEPDRSADAAERLLDDFGGVLSCDRYSAYRQYLNRQVCWAHLDRNLTELAQFPDPTRSVAADLKQVCDDVFAAWRDYADNHQDRARLQRRVARTRTRMRRRLDRAASNGRDKKARRFARLLLNDFDELWTFAHVDGVEPTNNDAERGLRRAVITRKISFGSQTENGTATTERLLTAAESCRRQGRSLYDYLTTLGIAATRGDPAPSLIPA